MTSTSFIPKWIHALKSGTWQSMNGSVSFSDADIARIAESYNPETHEAPAVVGHPQTDAPAYGWVRAAEKRDDGLWLNVDLMPELYEHMRRGTYRKVSVQLYRPDAPGNPQPGGYSLKHLGFLGAQPPAVKGLKSLALSESTETITIEFSEKESRMDEGNQEGQAPAAGAPAPQPATVSLSEDELKQREQKLAQREQALRRRELDGKLEPIVQAGKLLPADKPLVLALCERIDGESISLGEGSEDKPLLDQFVSFLEKQPAQVNLNEVAPGSAAITTPSGQSVSFATPDGCEVDTVSLAQHEKIKAHSRKTGKTYIEALEDLQLTEAL